MSSHNSFEDGNDHEVFIYVKEEMNSPPGDIVDADMLLNRESSDPLNEDYSRPFKGKEVLTLPNFNSGVQTLWQSQPPSTSEVNLYPLHADHSVPFKMFPQDYPHEVQYQEFQYFVVIDLKATCDKENNLQPQEIIEFPSVLVNAASGQLEAFFQTYVRPTHHQLLTDFCKELTGIEQIQVDKGVSLSEALLMHDRWLEDKGVKQKNFAVVTWSNWDCRVMLESECRFRRIRKPPYFNRWINLKIPFQEVYGDVQCKLKEAVQLAGLVWEGRAHCGLDDARNTARLLTVIMNHGFRFFITNWLTLESQDYQLEHKAHKQRQTIEPRLQFDPVTDKETGIYCFCGVMSSKCVVRKPGPTQGRWFYGCGNWSSARCALCHFFMWASP